MPEPIFTPSIVTLGLNALRELGNDNEARTAAFRARRRTPEGRAREAARRGEPSRALLLAELGLPSAARQIPSGGSPPGSTPPGPTTGPGVDLLPIPVPPGAVPIPLPGQIPSSIPVVPFPVSGVIVPSGPRIGPVRTREQIGRAEIERMLRRERVQAARGARMERVFRRRAIMRMAGRVAARVGSVVTGVLWPNDVAPGTPTPGQVREMERAAVRDRSDELQPIAVRQERLTFEPKPPVPELQAVNPTAQRIRVPQSATTPRSPTAPTVGTPGSSPSPRTRGVLSRLPWAQILLGAALGRSPTGSTVTNIIESSAPTPLTQPEPQPLPSPGGPPIILTGSAGRTDLCPEPKRRKPARKCLERAQVEWRTGRYKGKIAGTKCVRFARRK